MWFGDNFFWRGSQSEIVEEFSFAGEVQSRCNWRSSCFAWGLGE